MAFSSFATTSLGNFAKESGSANDWPSVRAHLIMPLRASRLPVSPNLAGISSQVKLQIGYAVLPSALVMETRKSSGMDFAALAAAALTLVKSALTNAPEEFFTVP